MRCCMVNDNERCKNSTEGIELVCPSCAAQLDVECVTVPQETELLNSNLLRRALAHAAVEASAGDQDKGLVLMIMWIMRASDELARKAVQA